MEKDFIIIKEAVSKELCRFMAEEYRIIESVYNNLYPGCDSSDMCSNSFARYAPLCFETLSLFIQPIIEDHTGKKLYPTYSYARIYYTGSELTPHKDRHSSEYTVSICVEKDNINWPLFIKDSNNTNHKIDLNTGDIVIYSGKNLLHWREKFTGKMQIQAFLQYVDVNGKYSKLKWDTRPSLGLPFEFVNNDVKRELGVNDS